MAKTIKTVLKLQLKGGQATPAPPVGTVLGPHGINIADFCKQFNEATKDKMGDVIPVDLTIYEDRSFTFKLKTPPAAELLKKAAGIEKGSGVAAKKKVGKVTKDDLKNIAEIKMEDLNTDSLEQAVKIIEGTAKNMGITVE